MSRKVLLLLITFAVVFSGVATAQLSVVTSDSNLANAQNQLDAACVKNGNYAMRTNKVSNVNDEMYVVAEAPKANFVDETAVTFQFWFNASSMALPNKGRHWIVAGEKGENSRPKKPFKAQFRRTTAGDPAIRIKCINHNNCQPNGKCGYTTGGTLPITEDQWHLVQLTWAAGTLDDGICRLEVVEGAPTGLKEKANYEAPGWTVGGALLGMFGPGIIEDANGSGKHCYDDFVATRTAP